MISRQLVVVVGSGMCRFGSPVCQLFEGCPCQLLGRRSGTLQCELPRSGEFVLEDEGGRTREAGDPGNAVTVHQALGAAGKRETKCNLFADGELAGVEELHGSKLARLRRVHDFAEDHPMRIDCRAASFRSEASAVRNTASSRFARAR